MKRYKTSERQRVTLKAQRDAIKVAGGEEYQKLLAKEREQRAAWRRANREKIREYERTHQRTNGIPFKTNLCARARFRGRKRGLEATITAADLVWPSHCPALGIALDYPERTGTRKDLSLRPNWPSLDRWDSTKGYVPGNVFVISHRANTLKGSVSREEILRIAKYVMSKPSYRTDECVATGIFAT